MKIKIAAYQMEIVPGDIKANLKKIKNAATVAYKNKCHFFCIPEECWAGLHYIENKDNEVADFVKEKASQIARENKFYFIAGTFVEKHRHVSGALHKHNFCYIFGPSGKIIGRYAKRHPVPDLEKTIDPGLVHRVFETEYGKIGVQICRDILYSETTKITANLGAKIIFSPAFWFKFTSVWDEVEAMKKFHANCELRAIKYLVPARSIENEVIMVFTNAAGEYKTERESFTLLGYTQITQPYSGPIKIFKNNKEKLMIKTIDTNVIDLARVNWRVRGN